MSYSLSLFAGAGWQFFDNNGTILSGGKLYTYSAGTTTLITTYTTSSATVSNTNPIVLDSAGRVPNEIWINSASTAKFVLKTSDDVLIGTWDNIPSLVSSLNLTGVNNGVVYFNSVGTFTSGTNLTFDGTNLRVAGAATIGSNLYVAGPSALTGNVTASGALNVTGTTTLSGNASVGGTLNVTGNVINTLNVTGTLTTSGTTTLATGATVATNPAITDITNKIATTSYVNSIGLGSSQSWINPWGIGNGTSYYNTYGKPFAIAWYGTSGVGAAIVTATINGVTAQQTTCIIDASTFQGFVIIPTNAPYSFTWSASVATLTFTAMV